MNDAAREKLDNDRAWRDQLDPAHLDEVNGLELAAEANHYEKSLRAVLDLADACETAIDVSDGTVLAAVVKLRMGAYENVCKAITDALAGDGDE